jgi:hypothetical protein
LAVVKSPTDFTCSIACRRSVGFSVFLRSNFSLLRFDPSVFQIAPGELAFPFDLLFGVTICDVTSSWCGPSLSTGQGLDFDLVLCWLFRPSAHAPSTHPISLLVLMLFHPHIDFCSHLVRMSSVLRPHHLSPKAIFFI